MKILVFLLSLFMVSPCFSQDDNTAILNNDLSITMPNIIYQGSIVNYKIVLKYVNNHWELQSIDPVNTTPPPNPTVDSYGSNEAQVLSEINKYRANGAPCSAGGLSPLSWDQKLTDASLGHSIDMAANNYFEHYSQNGDSPWTRISAAGFTGSPLGENIAAGWAVSQVVGGWIDSPGHCTNIMNPSANVMGYGWATKADSQWGIYHTMATGRK